MLTHSLGGAIYQGPVRGHTLPLRFTVGDTFLLFDSNVAQ